uniref:Ig-like domain-containing protein n=1 Tax=Labrus bergylta TaxID=56723 RepID=A0A3Q3GNT1_9LABR
MIFISLLSAVTPVFVRTGTDLRLEVKKPVVLKEADLFTWKVNGSVNVVRLAHGGKPIISPNYTSRAELSAQNHSLLLKNVQKRDSGVYRASVTADKDITVAEYSVTVLDPVSGVKLTVKLCSSDSTKVTVICSTEDSLISSTFTCDTQTCSHEGGERAEIITPGASLDVYLENGSAICNHGNQVSSTRDIQKIEDLCRKPEGKSSKLQFDWPVVLCILGFGVFHPHEPKSHFLPFCRPRRHQLQNVFHISTTYMTQCQYRFMFQRVKYPFKFCD